MTRCAKFSVSYDLLRALTNLPPDTTITAISPLDGHSCWFTVIHPDLPEADYDNPPVIHPYAIERKLEWHWNAQENA